MESKGRFTIRILAGGYLFYLGLNLVRDVIREGIDGKIPFALSGIVFVVLGVAIMFNAYKHLKEINRIQKEGANKATEKETEDEPEAVIGEEKAAGTIEATEEESTDQSMDQSVEESVEE